MSFIKIQFLIQQKFILKKINHAGRVFYNHALDEQIGITYMSFNLTDRFGNSLPDQKLAIIIRG